MCHEQVRPFTAVVDGHLWRLPGLQPWGPSCPTLHAVFMGISTWAEGLKIKNMIHPSGGSEEAEHCFPALLWVLSVLRSGCSFYPFIWCTTYLISFQKVKIFFYFLKLARTCFVTFSQIIQTNMMIWCCYLNVMVYGNESGPSVSLCMCMLVTQLCPTLCNPMDSSLPGSSVRGILQARTLEWIPIPFSKGSFRPRDQTWVSCVTGGFFTVWATRNGERCVF